MSQSSPAQYLISLCTSAQGSNQSFGIATRIGLSSSQFKFEATKVIHSIVTFSPAADTVATEFLVELQKVKDMSSLVKPVVDGIFESDCSTWAVTIINHLRQFSPKERLTQLEPVTNLATVMLSHLLVAIRNPGGMKTPQETYHPTPNLMRIREIEDLIEDATNPTKRSQSALKELLFKRDGYFCPFTRAPFDGDVHVVARAAHVLPFSFHDKHLTLKALENFTGRQLAEEVKQNINHPSNAFLAETNAHDIYDKLSWGIEAVRIDDQWKYIYRIVHPNDVSFFIRIEDGDEIRFGLGADGQHLDKPDPEYCNLKLALARVFHACGAADVIAELYGDDDVEAVLTQPVYLGGPLVSDDILFRRLDDRLSIVT